MTQTQEDKNAYEIRNADYSIVHNDSDEDFLEFITALSIKQADKVIDIGGGYGSIFIRLIEHQPDLIIDYDLLDGGLFQLKKGEERINKLLIKHNNKSTVRYMHQDATMLDLEPDQYDLVICKMFLHEIPIQHKKKIFKNLFDITKPGSRIFFWNPDLTPNNYSFYTDVIKKKDELAGFQSMVENRHFLLNQDFYEFLAEAGFINANKLMTFDYHLDTKNRLHEEFHGDRNRLQEWNAYILRIAAQLDLETTKQLNIQVSADNVYINFKRGIFSAQKPG